jgi:hypothetical protein
MSRAAALLGKTMMRKSFPISRKKSAPRFNKNFTTRRTVFTRRIRRRPMPSRSSWEFVIRPTAPPWWMRLSPTCARGNALTAGDVGYRYLLRALADGGRSDVIFDINNQSDKPGYGMQLEKGRDQPDRGVGRRARLIAKSFHARPDSGMVLSRPRRNPKRAGQRRLQKNRHQSAARRRRDLGEGEFQFHPGKNCQRLETRRRENSL